MPVDAQQLRIVMYPDPVLREKAQHIQSVTQEVRQVAARMVELMHDAGGVGLAAPQVGLSWRLFVANTTGEKGDDHIFVNPNLIEPADEIEAMEEGCLSIPDVRGVVRRPRAITIEATGLDGQPLRMTSDALPARVWQHEADHLDGVLIIDRMSPIDKIANRRLIKDLESRS